ncbi:hypothetical protein [Scytonema sp. UIC 10036]|nr:hypothetical protein [Scytonema sp. UIC 10036]
MKQNRRSRGVILTLKGWDKLQGAKTKAVVSDKLGTACASRSHH